ncbi:MAG: polyamine aminopropyltransferase [Pseudomonadota bacterium]
MRRSRTARSTPACGKTRILSKRSRLLAEPDGPSDILLSLLSHSDRLAFKPPTANALRPMQGLHLTADLYGCRCSAELLTDAAELASLCRDAVVQAGLTLVDEKYHTFPDHDGQPGGVTGAVLLAESHLAVHTWPERGGVTLDVYVCNFSTDNSRKAEQLLTDLLVAFAPSSQGTHRIMRGSADPYAATDELMVEWLNDDSAYGFRATRRLETIRTPYQTLEVFDTPQWGKLFRLDGSYMSSERDEFFYHECLIHPAAIAHPAPASALVIGGGDGGSTEELLKHPSMKRVIMAELDPAVIDMSRRYLKQVHRGALDDPRLDIRIGDGWAITEEIARNGPERFDLVVLDLTDPDTPAHRLYTTDFFALVRRVMNPGASLVLHVGSPVYKPDLVARLVGDLRSMFSQVHPYGLYIPLYGSYWGMAIASDSLSPHGVSRHEVRDRLTRREIADLNYYNEDTHHALFALPGFYRDLVASSTPTDFRLAANSR